MNVFAEFLEGDSLPSEWRLDRLENIGYLHSGSTPARSGGSRFFGGEIPWVKTGDLNNSRIGKTEEYLTAEGLTASSCRVLPKDTVLVAMYGGFKQIGRNGVLAVPAATNQAISALVCDNARVDSMYVLYWLNAYRFLWREFAGSSRKDPNITKLDVASFPIILPPLSEQHRIANILCTWDDALEKLARLIEAKECRNNALMQQLLVGRKRLAGYAGHWRSVQIGEMLEEVRRDLKWSDDQEYDLLSVRRRSGGIFRRGKMFGHQIETKLMKEVKAGDFLISKMQVVHGAWALVGSEFDGAHVSGSYLALVTKDPEQLNVRFFDWLSRTRRLVRMALLSSWGVVIEKMTFNLSDFLRRHIHIPPTEAEQTAIVEALDTCHQEVCLLRQQRDAIERQKRGLMQRLLTGRIRVKAV